MSRSVEPQSLAIRRASAGLFLIGLSIWTWKLLEPKPVSDEFIGELLRWSDWLPFLLAKTLHFTGYAGLTGLVVIALGRHWPIGVVLMLFHGMGSEIGQTFVVNRTGKLTDVLLDSCGILTGVVVSRQLLFWLARRTVPPQQTIPGHTSADEDS